MPDRYLGRQLGRYRVTRLLGSGSFSWVYEAVDSLTGQPVALKVLRPEFTGNKDAETRFRREAQTAGRLNHPNIIAVRDVGQTDDSAYVAMDLLPLSLARRLELVHRLPEPEVVRIGLDVASALAIAHAEGVVHRDIKPDNILLTENGDAVVADFGLAHALEGDAAISSAQQVMGTPHYFSPEQARGLQVDGRTDLYALGVTLYRAATGRLPYEGDDWYSVARQHIESEIPSPRALVPELTSQFDALITRLLAKKPENRFATATLVVDALAQLPTAPSTAVRTGSGSADVTMVAPAPRSALYSPRRRWLQRVGAVAGVLTLGMIALAVIDQARGGVWWALLNGTANSRGRPTEPSTARSDSTRRDLPFTQPVSTDTTTPVLPGRSNPGTATASNTGGQRTRPTPATTTARVVLTSNNDASLFIDGRAIGVGKTTTDIRTDRNVVVRALLPSAPVECRWAQHDTTVRLQRGATATINLPVSPCGRLQFDVVPAEAVISLRMHGGDVARSFRADSVGAGTSRALVLPIGQYAIVAQANGYRDYTDSSMRIVPQNAIVVKRIRMITN